MNENKLSLSSCTIQHVGPLMRLPGGLLKREITIGYGHHHTFIVDEIRKEEGEFYPVDPMKCYDLLVWANGLRTRGGVAHKFCLKSIREANAKPVAV